MFGATREADVCGRIAVAVAVPFLFLPVQSLLAQRGAPPPLFADVYVHLQVVDDTPGTVLNALRGEATRIWLRHRVNLTWAREAPTVASSPAVVALVFDHRMVAQHRDGEHDALARTVFAGRMQTVYISMRRAWQMLRSMRGANDEGNSEGARDVRAGTLLGRVVAHEIGHVILTSLGHSRRGLMRPVFGLQDVLSGDDHLTQLSAVESERLATRFSLVPLTASEPPDVLARRQQR
jgi:hypothetical protein